MFNASVFQRLFYRYYFQEDSMKCVCATLITKRGIYIYIYIYIHNKNEKFG
jgi:hypothetical protein